MTICDLWTVVVAPFPFVDSSHSKPRPCLVLSARPANAATGHSVCAMITRPLATRWPNDTALQDWRGYGLPAASVVRWKLFTLENGIFKRVLAPLSSGDRRQCQAALSALLGNVE
jgi:mRNA interferase MazF